MAEVMLVKRSTEHEKWSFYDPLNLPGAHALELPEYISRETEVCGIKMSFVTKLCEAVFVQTTPNEPIVNIGGVNLRLTIKEYGSLQTPNWLDPNDKTPYRDTRYERFMLMGEDWSLGFNAYADDVGSDALKALTTDHTVYSIFATSMRIFAPIVHDEENFERDMVVLRMFEREIRQVVQP